MAQDFKPNYDESQVPPYSLPDPLVAEDGHKITTADEWTSRRRPELLRLFETHVYGRAPQQKPKLEFKTTAEDKAALDGAAIRKEVTIDVATDTGHVPLHLLLYVPKSQQPAPVFLGLNFMGNQGVHSDPGIALAATWMRDRPNSGIVEHRATDASRGKEAASFQIDDVIRRGYAVASMYCGDIEPDSPDAYSKGVRRLYARDGQVETDADEWGTLAAWAWGLSRALDYLATEPLVDAKRVAVWGHSRLGKAALWAGATDPRFALVISNESGCGGAALSKRIYGETVGRINSHFPHWFCRNFQKYNENEDALPIDQHQLIALIAPRPVYVASAEGDRWADPLGEFLAAKKAEPVYQLFSLAGLGTDEMPALEHPVGDTIGYHIRSGKHAVTAYDWQQYCNFADRHLR
jgi:(4-O-methyl)-D-glucuronate---lignin esterase